MFPKNLLNVLSQYNPADPIYLGDVWHPSSQGINAVQALDGSDHTTNIDFVQGGGGSLFSRAALQMMDLDKCIKNSGKGGQWYGWQSDWIIAACANQYSIQATAETR